MWKSLYLWNDNWQSPTLVFMAHGNVDNEAFTTGEIKNAPNWQITAYLVNTMMEPRLKGLRSPYIFFFFFNILHHLCFS